MKTKQLLLVLLVIGTACSCGTKKENAKNAEVLIPVAKEIAEVNDLAPYIESVKFVTIPEEKKTLLGEISKMLIDKRGNLYISDISEDKLIVLKPDGSFFRKVAKKGRGPKEYTGIVDIALSTDGDEIMILDSKKILCYGISDTTKFHSINIKLNKDYYAIAPAADGGAYLFSADFLDDQQAATPLLDRIDKEGNVVKEQLPKEDRTFPLANITQSYDNSYFLRPQNSKHQIIRLTPDSVMTAYRIDFGDKAIPPKYYYDVAKEDIHKYMTADYYKLPIYIHDTKEVIYFKSPYGTSSYSFVYSPQKRKGISWQDTQNYSYQTIPIASDSSYLYWLAPAILFSKEEGDKDVKLGALDRYLLEQYKGKAGISETNNNPVIVKIKFRI